MATENEQQKNVNAEELDIENTNDEVVNETAQKEGKADKKDKKKEKAAKKSEAEKLKEQLAESNDKYLRLMAEYDNFRKRTAKERLDITSDAKGDTVLEILPVIDNFERALATETTDENYKQGIEMIFNQFNEVLAKLGIEVINPEGEEFDPNFANAVNQIEDPELGNNVVAQVFQKGYKIGDKVIRYAMVVVANP